MQTVSQSVSQYICHSDLTGTGRNGQKTKVSLFMYLFSEHDLFFIGGTEYPTLASSTRP